MEKITPSMLQERARALSELRRLEADIGEALRNLKGAQGEEEALRNKAVHLRDDIDRAELARDKALVAHDKAQAVSFSAAVGLFTRQLKLYISACRRPLQTVPVLQEIMAVLLLLSCSPGSFSCTDLHVTHLNFAASKRKACPSSSTTSRYATLVLVDKYSNIIGEYCKKQLSFSQFARQPLQTVPVWQEIMHCKPGKQPW